MAVVRDEEYAVVVERERPLLQACAFLLTAEEERADRLVQLVLARMYERWDDVRRPRVEALRSLVQTSPHDPLLPWDTGPRIQLIDGGPPPDRKSTRLNSSHANISYAVFCLKKKKKHLHTSLSTKIQTPNSLHNT